MRLAAGTRGQHTRPPRTGLPLAGGVGFAVGLLGIALGTMVARPDLRPLVLVGDGAFQMTGMEISHAPKYGLSPIVVVVNNGGWGIFRPVSPRQDLLEIDRLVQQHLRPMFLHITTNGLMTDRIVSL